MPAFLAAATVSETFDSRVCLDLAANPHLHVVDEKCRPRDVDPGLQVIHCPSLSYRAVI